MDQLKETVVGAFHLDVSAHFYTDFVLLMGIVWLLGGQAGGFVFWETALHKYIVASQLLNSLFISSLNSKKQTSSK